MIVSKSSGFQGKPYWFFLITSGDQDLGRAQLGESFAPRGLCCEHSVFAGSPAGRQGQGGPCQVPGPKRACITRLCSLVMPLRGPSVAKCDFVPGGFKSESSKGQEVEAASLLRPGHQYWHSVPSAILPLSKISQATQLEGGGTGA